MTELLKAYLSLTNTDERRGPRAMKTNTEPCVHSIATDLVQAADRVDTDSDRPMSATVDDVMSWGPCWVGNTSEAEARARLTKLWRGRESLTAIDILALRSVSHADRIWAVLREEMIPAETLHLLVCDFAERALLRERSAGRKPDPRSRRAIEVRRQWVRGEASGKDLAAAARECCGDAAWAAAWAAAEDVQAAAWDAAAQAAARDARTAARAAEWAAEERWQMACIHKRLLAAKQGKPSGVNHVTQ